jgi:hypothetical protein
MSADDRDSGAAQLFGNGGKIEPYTIIIMGKPNIQRPWGDHPPCGHVFVLGCQEDSTK